MAERKAVCSAAGRADLKAGEMAAETVVPLVAVKVVHLAVDLAVMKVDRWVVWRAEHWAGAKVA